MYNNHMYKSSLMSRHNLYSNQVYRLGSYRTINHDGQRYRLLIVNKSTGSCNYVNKYDGKIPDWKPVQRETICAAVQLYVNSS